MGCALKRMGKGTLGGVESGFRKYPWLVNELVSHGARLLEQSRDKTELTQRASVTAAGGSSTAGASGSAARAA